MYPQFPYTCMSIFIVFKAKIIQLPTISLHHTNKLKLTLANYSAKAWFTFLLCLKAQGHF